MPREHFPAWGAQNSKFSFYPPPLHVTISSANGQTWPNTVTSTQKFNNVNTLSVLNNCIQVTTLGTMSVQTTTDSQHFLAAFLENDSSGKMLSKNI